ncbi:MAG: metallophosphoesterase [Deltaproteobacteria bacterium]|nr:metallophosphoesterase [Deltaproteobacteria bacterium]
MRRIKLVFSDFHLGKGRLDEYGRINPLEDFHDDRKLIEFLQYYGEKRFFPDEIELVVNGDFFELLVVDEHDLLRDRETEQTALRKLHRIFEGHKEVFDALVEFNSRPRNSITFLPGNHDSGLLWPKVQEALIERLGPSTRIVAGAHNIGPVHIAHGNHHEFAHSYNVRNFSYRDARGEHIFRLPMGDLFVKQFLSIIKRDRPYIDKVKPFTMYLKYAFVNDHFFWSLLFGLARFWLSNRFSRDPVRRREFRLSLNRVRNALTHESMDKAAYNILKSTSYRYVIFGHSHKQVHKRFGAYGEYINTGTWNEVISLQLPHLGQRVERTYVHIDATDEDEPVVRVKRWIGSHQLEEDIAL